MQLNWTEIKELVYLVLVVISIILSIVAWILRKSSNKKAQNIAANLEGLASNALSINNLAQKYITLAEQFIEYSGDDKKQWVISHIKEECINAGIKYEDATIDKAIENLIAFSKKVNTNDIKRIEQQEEETNNE